MSPFGVIIEKTRETIMLNNHNAILQLPKVYDAQLLKQAYIDTRVRFNRMTQMGPLGHYRHDLQLDAQMAYEHLSGGADDRPHHAAQSYISDAYMQMNAKQQCAIREDDFCREVLYRIEGTLIRYAERKALLEIALENEISLFKANLLICQICESLRTHQVCQENRFETVFKFWHSLARSFKQVSKH